MDSDDYYNPRLKHSFEYQEMFSRLRYTQPTQQLPVIRYPLSIKFPETPNDEHIDGFFNVKILVIISYKSMNSLKYQNQSKPI
jgi:hypothetical protein